MPDAKAGEFAAALALLAYEGRYLDGDAFPSVASLAALAGLSERAMQGKLNALLARRRLTITLRRGRSSVYRMTMPGKPNLAPLRKASAARAPAESAPPAQPAPDQRKQDLSLDPSPKHELQTKAAADPRAPARVSQSDRPSSAAAAVSSIPSRENRTRSLGEPDPQHRAQLGAIADRFGPAAESDAREVLVRREARQHPAAARQALERLLSEPKERVARPGALLQSYVRLAIAKRLAPALDPATRAQLALPGIPAPDALPDPARATLRALLEQRDRHPMGSSAYARFNRAVFAEAERLKRAQEPPPPKLAPEVARALKPDRLLEQIAANDALLAQWTATHPRRPHIEREQELLREELRRRDVGS